MGASDRGIGRIHARGAHARPPHKAQPRLDIPLRFRRPCFRRAFSRALLSAGRNDITKEAGGCLIQEHFLDANNSAGRSVSFVSPLDGLWHQTYIDSRGGRLVLVGRFEDGQMRLYQTPTQRFGWLAQSPDRIRYFEERTTDGGATWTVSFDSAYTRR